MSHVCSDMSMCRLWVPSCILPCFIDMDRERERERTHPTMLKFTELLQQHL